MVAVPERRRPRRLLTLLPLLPVLALAACGSGGTGGSSAVSGPDPATVTPRGAIVAGAVIVRPTGTVRTDATAAARRVLHTSDPGQKLRQLLDKAMAKDHETFARR